MSDTSIAVRADRRRRHRAWREGGSSTATWDLEMLGWALLCVGVGALASRAAEATLPVETRAEAARAVVWLSFVVPGVLALRRSRPRGLLVFRAVDVLYGAVFGILMRVAQGVIAGFGGVPAAWPSTFSVDGTLPDSFVGQVVAGALVSPVLEEVFFRGVVLVCAYSALRHRSGRVAAGIAAAALSSTLFVVAHALTATVDTPDLVALALLGAVTSAFVLGTGRIWAAVIVHVVFNLTGYGLIALGTLLG